MHGRYSCFSKNCLIVIISCSPSSLWDGRTQLSTNNRIESLPSNSNFHIPKSLQPKLCKPLVFQTYKKFELTKFINWNISHFDDKHNFRSYERIKFIIWPLPYIKYTFLVSFFLPNLTELKTDSLWFLYRCTKWIGYTALQTVCNQFKWKMFFTKIDWFIARSLLIDSTVTLFIFICN